VFVLYLLLSSALRPPHRSPSSLPVLHERAQNFHSKRICTNPMPSNPGPSSDHAQTLENIKMAYYWAGYYSGLYDGQHQARQQAAPAHGPEQTQTSKTS
jgi:hypothetical protein